MKNHRAPACIATLCIVLVGLSCLACGFGTSMSREQILAMQLHKAKFGTEVDNAIASGKLTTDEVDKLQGFRVRYSTEPFYEGQFPDGITVENAIKDERKFIEDVDPNPKLPG